MRYPPPVLVALALAASVVPTRTPYSSGLPTLTLTLPATNIAVEGSGRRCRCRLCSGTLFTAFRSTVYLVPLATTNGRLAAGRPRALFTSPRGIWPTAVGCGTTDAGGDASSGPCADPGFSRVYPEIVMVGAIEPATAVAWHTMGRLRSGVVRPDTVPGPVLTPQCPSFAMRPQSQALSHNRRVHPMPGFSGVVSAPMGAGAVYCGGTHQWRACSCGG